MTIYTPGSGHGVGLNIIGTLDVPADLGDPQATQEEIDAYVGSLLNLVQIEADPLSSREHILLSAIINDAWNAGRALDLATLVASVQQPPMRKVGVLELDSYYPPADRMKLALKLNGLLASPAFAAWLIGERIDIDAMLRTSDGRPRCAIVTTAHLDDEQRQSATSVILAKLISWMRRQSGTSDLRVLLYMDEVAGYLPPIGNPPDQAADHASAQAGPRLRGRRRALHPEPRRRRLQGAVQRGDVDDRAAADRAGQGPTPRRSDQRCRDHRPARGRRHHLRPRQAGVRPQAREQGLGVRVHHPVGDELPARAADARAGASLRDAGSAAPAASAAPAGADPAGRLDRPRGRTRRPPP